MPMPWISCSTRRFLDGATVGFGVRNSGRSGSGLARGGTGTQERARFVVLEFTTPPREPMRSWYSSTSGGYFSVIGRLISRHRDAHTYPTGFGARVPGTG